MLFSNNFFIIFSTIDKGFPNQYFYRIYSTNSFKYTILWLNDFDLLDRINLKGKYGDLGSRR